VIISAVWLISNFSVNALAIRIVKVSNGSYHSFGLTSDGRIYAWGRNTSGELGIGTTLARSNVPIAVKTTGTPMDGKVVKQVEGGGRYEGSHSIALASDGTVYTWGFNQYGQLGNNTTTNSRSPIAVQVAGTPLAGKTIVQIAAGADHSLALDSDGALYAWGSNAYGQLGNGTTTNSSVPVAVKIAGTPLAGKTIVQIAAGANHNMVLTSDGAVYTWGWNYHGQLGNNTKTNSNTIVAVQTIGTPIAGKKIVKIAAGQGHSLALTDDGMVYTWGRNDTGQLGNNATTDVMLPVTVTVTGTPMSNKTIVEIASGARHSLAIDSSGKVYAWGHNGSGQLGNNLTVNALTPVAVQAPADKNIIQVSGSGWLGASSSALASDGTVYSWGRGFDGQLGDGTNNDSSVPVITTINLVDTPSTPTHVMAKPGDTTAIISWQAPIVSGGQNITGYVLQYQAVGASSWTTINVAAAATSHTITGLTNDQTYRIRLAAKITAGTGDFSNVVLVTPHAKPTITNVSPAIGPVAGGQNVTLTGTNFILKSKKIMQTVNGNGYSLALSADSTIYTWGRNEYGQLGNGVTATNSPVPVAVKTAGTPMKGKTIVQISAKVWYALALASDGTVYSWGFNSWGQLGNGTSGTANNASAPVAVKTAGTPMEGKTIVQVAAGATHSLALATDGTIYAWGKNEYGQLGNDSTTNSPVPVAVKTAGTPMDGKTIIQIHAGYEHSLALASDGTVYAWGRNNSGQLGKNDATDAHIPAAVQTLGTPMAGKVIVQLAAGNSQSMALASDGTVYTWGWNQYGQLGNGTTTNSRIPVAVVTTGTPLAGKTISQIAAGNAHALAMTDDGAIYSWGWNQYGQLGNGTTTNSRIPVAVVTTGTPLAGKTIIQITSGGSPNSLVLADDGAMYTWGWGQYGQLGDSTIGTDAKVPVAVSTTPPSALAPSAPKVTFDGIEATNVTIVNSTTITATTPAHAAGLVDVAIDLGDGDELYKAAKTSSYRYATVPDAPTNLATAPLDNAVRLTWTAPANNGGAPITDYVIQYSADGGITWSTYSHIASTSTAVTIPFLTPTTYTFRVAAVNTIGTGAYSATATGQVRYITLSAPTSVDIAVTPAGGTKMSSKSANVLVATNAATGYKLSLSTQSTNRNLTNGSQTIAPTAGTQTAPIALSGSAWGYRVNGIGNFGSTTTAENNVASSAYTWAGVPDHVAPHVIRTTTVANPTAETTAVWYGVSVTGSQQSGIYTATVTYTAINN
jgi:alpha-tubulin suppressor-like RCC1 family protein